MFLSFTCNYLCVVFAQDEVSYEILEASDDARDYFLLEESTGSFILIKPLTQARAQYQVTTAPSPGRAYS